MNDPYAGLAGRVSFENVAGAPISVISGYTVEAVRDMSPGDWKTALARKIDGIKKGERATINEVWNNMEGTWVSIRMSDGRNIDVRAAGLKLITPEMLEVEKQEKEEADESNAMLFQACTYQAKQGDDWRIGIARVKCFGVSDVSWIVDAATGEKHKSMWDYRLTEGACKHITTRVL